MGQRSSHKRNCLKHKEMNENENITCQNLWDIHKAVLRRKSVALNAYIRKEEMSQSNNLSSHFKNLNKPKASKRKKMIK